MSTFFENFSNTKQIDEKRFMQIALNLAKKHLGMTSSNPSVGCVVVKDENIISYGVTEVSGRPHAEVVALSSKLDFKNASLFTTLEPCSHYGKTPPCTELIIKSGIKKVYIGAKDTDERVDGKGIKLLKEAGVKVFDLEDLEVQNFYKPYLTAKKRKRPFVTGKIACSMDGKIATVSGESKWITSDLQNQFTNFLRHKYDAILVGSNTYRQDTPLLTCRIEGLEEFSPIRFLLSSSIKKAERFNIVNGNLNDVLSKMYLEFGINHLLVEGGADIFSQFVDEDLLDEIMLIEAPIFIGKDGKSFYSKEGVGSLKDVKKFKLNKSLEIGGGIINYLSYV